MEETEKKNVMDTHSDTTVITIHNKYIYIKVLINTWSIILVIFYANISLVFLRKKNLQGKIKTKKITMAKIKCRSTGLNLLKNNLPKQII